MIARPGNLRRSLVAEVLASQLAVAAAVGLVALVGFTIITRSVVEANLTRWASNWAGQLDELGAPLYVGDEGAAIVDLDRYIESYPEVVQVALYAPDGSQIVAIGNGEDAAPLPSLSRDQIARLEPMAMQTPPGILTDEIGPRRYRLHGPIVVESLTGQDLLDFDPDTAEVSKSLLGFVGLELDFAGYLTGLWPGIATGGTLIALLILAGWAGSRQLIRRSLEPLAALELPLQQLGQGKMDINLPEPQHRELTTIVHVLRETIDALKQREQHLVHLASHDPLTGLFNRYRLMRELKEEIELCRNSGRTSALLFLDLDRFKYVNDTSGHAAGDQMLKTAAKLIRSTVRQHDFVARFGGDEFIVLLRDIRRRDARNVASQVLESMRHVTHSEGDHQFHLQCSIGVAMINSARHGPDDVVTHADLACRSAKQRGRNRVEVYVISSKQDEELARDARWMQQIRESLENDSFVLHFQPLKCVETGTIDHYETLIRLRTEDGLIGPASFLPAAARFGMMNTIDFWVIENAIRTLAELGPDASQQLKLAINLSGYTLEDLDLVPQLKSCLSKYGIAGEQLILEITEDLAVRFASDTDKRLEQIRTLGCAIAIDDFGTGYSSLSYLKRLPADYLKIDGAFIRNMPRDKVDQCMVRMTAELAREMGLRTVAEYVHSKKVMDQVAKYGIDYAQGSYIGRPKATLSAPESEIKTN